MNNKSWVRKAISTFSIFAILTVSSAVVLAGTDKAVGTVTIIGTNADNAAVLVNGEVAQNGRTIFSTSTISTPKQVGAIVDLGDAGKLQLAPETQITVSFDQANAAGQLTAGSVKVIEARSGISITNSNGETAVLNTGDSTTGKTAQDDDDDDAKAGAAWLPWALIMGGAVAGIVYAATRGDNRVSLGGGGTIVSPVR